MTTRLSTVAANSTASSSVRQTSESGTSPPTRAHDLLEPLPVLAALDRLDVGADQLDAVLLEHAGLVQGDREVERGLPAEGRQQRVRALAAITFSTNSGVSGST